MKWGPSDLPKVNVINETCEFKMKYLLEIICKIGIEATQELIHLSCQTHSTAGRFMA